jgi:hypothetical protein
MSRLWSILLRPVVSDTTAIRLGQFACFAAGPIVLVLALYGVSRYAATPDEVFLGVLASSAVALLLVVMGLVLPLARGKADA